MALEQVKVRDLTPGAEAVLAEVPEGQQDWVYRAAFYRAMERGAKRVGKGDVVAIQKQAPYIADALVGELVEFLVAITADGEAAPLQEAKDLAGHLDSISIFADTQGLPDVVRARLIQLGKDPQHWKTNWKP